MLRGAPLVLVAATSLALIGAASSARAGAEDVFQVNSFSTGDQTRPLVLAHPDGHYVVVWISDGQDGDGAGVFARLIGAGGQRVTPELRVNDTTAGAQAEPSAVITPAGDWFVAWTSIAGDGVPRVFGKRFSALAQPLSQERLVADPGERPEVGVDADGLLRVAYRAGGSVAVRQLDAEGVPAGDAVAVTDDADATTGIALSVEPPGDFVVAWSHQTYTTPEPYSDGYYERNSSVTVSRFAAGASSPAQSRVLSAPGNENYAPELSRNGDETLATWLSCVSDRGENQARPCYGWRVAAQRLAPDLQPLGDAFDVSGARLDYGGVGPAAATVHDSGRFTVVWNGPTPSLNTDGVIARHYAAEAQPSAVVVLEDDASHGDPLRLGVDVAAGAADDFLAVWDRDGDVFAAHVRAASLCEDEAFRPPRPGTGRFKAARPPASAEKTFRWVWYGETSALACVFDPAETEELTFGFRLTDASDPPKALEAGFRVPPCGAPPCWRYPKENVLLYDDPAGLVIDRMRFVVTRRGRARFVVRARGPGVELLPPLTAPITASFFSRAFATRVSFETAVVSTPDVFLAVGATPAPEP